MLSNRIRSSVSAQARFSSMLLVALVASCSSADSTAPADPADNELGGEAEDTTDTTENAPQEGGPAAPQDAAEEGMDSTQAQSSTDTSSATGAGRQMEKLNRGVVAVAVSNGVYVSWRLFGNEPDSISFNVYRNGTKVTSQPITNSTNYVDSGGNTSSTYTVRAVLNGQEQPASETANVWAENYLTVPLKTLAGYTPNDVSVGDLDGDGRYELIVKQEQTPKDNSQSGVTGQTLLEAYKLDGTFLWRINLGKNIREGAHYTQFLVYDFDGDGKAEVVCKTADGTVDGKGKVIGDASADYRNASGYVLSGPEFLTVFNGQTGAALATANYNPPRGKVASWGDSYGNRVDRFLATVAYLDGVRPSIVMTRGYYTRSVLAAWNWRDGALTQVWTFDSDNHPGYAGQGNHNISVGDVDSDGKDEIVFGAMAVDDNGKPLWTSGYGHGDAMHLTDIDPDRPGLEVFDIQERFDDAGGHLNDARTGQTLWKKPSVAAGDDGEGPGRGLAADIDAAHRGYEMWVAGAGITGLFDVKGKKISDTAPSSCNFAIWWDADPLRELLNSNQIKKHGGSTLLTANGCSSNNGTKSTPALSGDILGDWREEVIWRTTDNKALRIYTTTTPTTRRLFTLMHDPIYRLAIAWQNVGYNQPPHTSFYLGDGMANPPKPSIYLTP